MCIRDRFKASSGAPTHSEGTQKRGTRESATPPWPGIRARRRGPSKANHPLAKLCEENSVHRNVCDLTRPPVA
eukprot:11820296-Prorocentrum_lima.AAC.1